MSLTGVWVQIYNKTQYSMSKYYEYMHKNNFNPCCKVKSKYIYMFLYLRKIPKSRILCHNWSLGLSSTAICEMIMTFYFSKWQSEDEVCACGEHQSSLVLSVKQHQNQQTPPYQLMDEYTGMSACSPRWHLKWWVPLSRPNTGLSNETNTFIPRDNKNTWGWRID